MSILIVLIFLLFFVLSNIFIKNKLKKIIVNVYLFIWLLVLFLSSYNFYGLYEVSEPTYLIILASVFFFLIGTFFNNNFNNKCLLRDRFNIDSIYNYINILNKNKIIFYISILNTLIITRYYFLYQIAVSVVGAEKARSLRFFTGLLFQNTYEIYFFNYYFESIAIFYAIFVVICAAFQKINKLFFIGLLYCFFYSGIGAGRFFLVELSYYFLILLLIKSYLFNIKINKRLKILFLATISSMYMISIYFVNSRRGINEFSINSFLDGNKVLFEQGIVYNIGALRALDYGLENYPYKIDNNVVRLYLGGVDEIICVFFNLFGANIEYANAKLGKITFEEINIGNGYGFNALYTNILPMYLDFSLLGVVIYSFINGFIFSLFFKKMFNHPNIMNIIIFTFITVTFYLTTMTWKYSAPSTWIFLTLCLFINKKLVK